jgi:hypothetical protein
MFFSMEDFIMNDGNQLATDLLQRLRRLTDVSILEVQQDLEGTEPIRIHIIPKKELTDTEGLNIFWNDLIYRLKGTGISVHGEFEVLENGNLCYAFTKFGRVVDSGDSKKASFYSLALVMYPDYYIGMLSIHENVCRYSIPVSKLKTHRFLLSLIKKWLRF